MEQITVNKKQKAKSKKLLSEREGFTLIELVVVMMIIAALAVGLWANFTTSLIKGRDSRRKQDLDNIGKAMELYYQDSKSYPIPTPGDNPAFNKWGKAFLSSFDDTVIYMSKVPQDPTYPQHTYCYESNATGSYYKLYAYIENANDPQIFVTPATCDGLAKYNYGVSSTNVSF